MPPFKTILSAPVPENGDLNLTLHPLTLTFTGPNAAFESDFWADYVKKTLPQLRFTTLLSTFFYALFALLDAVVAPDLKIEFWIIRFGIVCPTFLLIYLFSYSARFPKYVQPSLAGGMIIAGLGIIYMTVAGNDLVVKTYYAGLMLVLMVGYSLVWTRFIWASLAGWLLVLTYIVTAASNSRLPVEIVTNNAFFCLSANVIGMAICYAIEYYGRRDYYMRRLLNEEHQKVAAARNVLEERVSDRTRMLAETNDELRREIEAHQRLDWEKHILEGQLRHAQKMEAIGTLAGGIAHDFNNILAAIMGHCELALMQLSDRKEAESCLSEVLTASHRAKDLVGQILAFSRQSESELQPLQVSLVVKEAMRLLKATLPSSITIEQSIRAPQSIIVADATQIHQIAINLCTNAAHAMTPQGGTLKVALEEVDIEPRPVEEPEGDPTRLVPGQYVRFRVADSGHGIPEHLVERIFDPYFTTKDKGVGTGLGLAVVRGIVQNHGGLIQVSSRPNEGTQFDVYLPRTEGKYLPQHQPFKLLSMGNERILLVDDEKGLAELGANLLTALGYRVSSFTAPEAALAAFREKRDDFDLVVTDMIMPRMSGEVLAREMLQVRPDIPIIVYTGFTTTISAEKIKQMGIKAVLRKPITIHGLSRAIRKVLMDQMVAGQQQTD